MSDHTDAADDTADEDGPNAQTSPVTERDTEATAAPESSAGNSPVDGDTAEVRAAESDRSDDQSGGRDLVTYVQWAAFAILCLLALVATFRAYFAASEAIRIWFSRDFVPVFQFAFNLLVLIASAAGISVLVRRLR